MTDYYKELGVLKKDQIDDFQQISERGHANRISAQKPTSKLKKCFPKFWLIFQSLVIRFVYLWMRVSFFMCVGAHALKMAYSFCLIFYTDRNYCKSPEPKDSSQLNRKTTKSDICTMAYFNR